MDVLIYTMPVEEIDVDNVRSSREASKKAAKETAKVDKSLRVKAAKRPMPAPSSSCDRSPSAQQEVTEYKMAIPLLLIESVSKMAPKLITADGERLRQRLLRSPDIGALATAAFATVDIQSPKLQFLATIAYHITSEWVSSVADGPRSAALPASSATGPAAAGLEDVTPAPTPDV